MPAVELQPVTTIASSDGVHLALYDFGGSGPTTLFIHATGFCAATWWPAARRIADLRSWAIDVRAHGRSGRPSSGDLSWARATDDVLAAVTHLGGGPLFGVGHSFGGALLLLAEQRQPGTFGALWCFEPIVIPPSLGRSGAGPDLASIAARRRTSFPSRDAARENFASKPPMNVFTEEALEAYLDGGFDVHPDGSLSLRCLPEDESRVFEQGAHNGAWERLGEVRCPVTVVRGRLEPGPALFAAAVADALPRGLLLDLPQVGHFGPMEAPELIASEIRSAFVGPPYP